MEAISLETTENKVLITVDKNSINPDFVIRLVEQLRMEYLAQKVNFNEDIEKVAENIKSEWWNNNKSRLLGKE
jgi:hypothetical protein